MAGDEPAHKVGTLVTACNKSACEVDLTARGDKPANIVDITAMAGEEPAAHEVGGAATGEDEPQCGDGGSATAGNNPAHESNPLALAGIELALD